MYSEPSIYPRHGLFPSSGIRIDAHPPYSTLHDFFCFPIYEFHPLYMHAREFYAIYNKPCYIVVWNGQSYDDLSIHRMCTHKY